MALAFLAAVTQLRPDTVGVMSFRETILLSVAGLFAGYLHWQHRRRIRQRLTAERQWTGRALDASRVAPRIQQLREDYLAGLHSCSRDWAYRRALIASARRALAWLAFFRPRQAHLSDHENGTGPR